MMRRRYSVPAVIAALVAAAVMVMCGSALAAEAPTTGCPEIVLYFARGSGQPLIRSEHGLAAPGEQLRMELAARFGANNVGSVANAYTAVGLTREITSGRFRGTRLPNLGLLREYGPSVANGTQVADQNIADIVGLCPRSLLVLGGYSQGAQVIRGALSALDAQDQQHIVAVVLFGDPLFSVGDQAVERFSTFNAAQAGLFTGLIGRLLGFKGDAVPAGYEGKVFSWCHANDVVCQGFALGNGWATHKTYDADVHAAVEQIAERLAAEGLTPMSGVASVEQEHGHPYEVTGTCSAGACALAEWGAAGRSGSSALGAIPDGRLVSVRCQTHGERISGDNGRSSTIWDQLTNRAFVPDFYLSTPNVGQFSPPIPRC
jgi:hypothetical protein